MKNEPNKFSEEAIQQLVDSAELDLPIWAYFREGPRHQDFVCFYTDYEEDDVRISPDYYWVNKEIADKAFEVILLDIETSGLLDK